jgi:hypothetical protein
MAANDLFKVGNPLLPCSALKLSQDVNPSLYSFLFFFFCLNFIFGIQVPDFGIYVFPT